MSCLHLVSFGADKPTALAQLRSALHADDAILLMADGMALASALADLTQAVYCWDASLTDGLNDDAVVALTLTFDKSISWHD